MYKLSDYVRNGVLLVRNIMFPKVRYGRNPTSCYRPKIYLSLDGNRNTYKYMRGVDGYYKVIMDIDEQTHQSICRQQPVIYAMFFVRN